MDNTKHGKELVFFQILYLFVIPTMLLYFDVLPENFRFFMIFSVAVMLLGIARHNKWTYEDIGIKRDFMKDIVPYSIFTISGVLFLFWLAQVVPHERFLEWWESARFLLLFIPLSIVQEVIFRGFLMKMLQHVFTSSIFIIVTNASLFAMMHVIYANSIFVLPFTFIAGVGFAWIYYQYKNLPLISFAHTILNFVAVALGFFVIR